MKDTGKLAISSPPPPIGFGWLRSEIEHLFEDFGRPMMPFASRGGHLWPALELVEHDGEFVLTAELPGTDPAQIHLGIANNVLTLKAEKHQESEKRDDGLLMSERRYGVFERKLALPADADSDKISAGFVNGVLTIRIGKNSKASASRRIPVDVG